MRVIFLDIDGVLATGRWQKLRPPVGLLPRSRGPQAFDPDCVVRLRELIGRTDASLVLSSTWRLDGGVGHVERLLERDREDALRLAVYDQRQRQAVTSRQPSR